MESLKGDGAADDSAREGFEGLGIGGIEVDIIVYAESAPAPRTENFDAFVGKKVVLL